MSSSVPEASALGSPVPRSNARSSYFVMAGIRTKWIRRVFGLIKPLAKDNAGAETNPRMAQRFGRRTPILRCASLEAAIWIVPVRAGIFAACVLSACGGVEGALPGPSHTPSPAMRSASYLAGTLLASSENSVTILIDQSSTTLRVSELSQICRRTCEAKIRDLQMGDRIEASAYVDTGQLVASWIVANGVSGYAILVSVSASTIVVQSDRDTALRQTLGITRASKLSCDSMPSSCIQSFRPGDRVFFTGTSDTPQTPASVVWILSFTLLNSS